MTTLSVSHGPHDPHPTAGGSDPEQLAAWCRLAFDVSPIGISFVSADRRPLAVNPAMCRILGRSPEELASASIDDLTHPDDRHLHLEPHRRLLAGETDRYRLEKRYLRPDGRVVWVSLHVALVREDGQPALVVSQCEDISALKAATARITWQATHDPLTGLPNRAHFLEQVEAILTRDGGAPPGAALLFIDVDEFKAVNDQHGHHVGDEVLVAVAGRLVGGIRSRDLSARFGGDEFVAFVHDEDPSPAPTVAARLAAALRRPARSPSGAALPAISVSIGVAPVHGADLDQLLREADDALYAAKAAGRDRTAVYSAAG